MIEALQAQLVPPLGEVMRPLRRIKRRRNDGDYAGSEDRLHAEDVEADLPAAAAVVDAVKRLLPEMTVYASRRP